MTKPYALNEPDLLTEYVVTDPSVVETLQWLIAWLRASLLATIQELVRPASDSED
jgi:hypothetical protein